MARSIYSSFRVYRRTTTWSPFRRAINSWRVLQPEAAEEILRTKVLRVLFQQGFFKLRALKIDIERMPVELHLPYWLAFYGSNGSVKCRVMDAVRRRIEGAKASSFFEEWLAA